MIVTYCWTSRQASTFLWTSKTWEFINNKQVDELHKRHTWPNLKTKNHLKIGDTIKDNY